ncbi:MAG: hypothetical protein ACRDKW_05580 [Actinomycetota bacterium]
MAKRAGAVVLAAVVLGVLIAAPAVADNNRGDVWLTNSAAAGSGHAHVPHLDCSTIYMHGSDLDASGTYAIESIPGTGSGMSIVSNAPWATPATGDVIATLHGQALVDLAVDEDDAVANPNQGYHFKLTLSQSGVKHKVFWVDCGPAPAPALTITKTADAASVTAGAGIGFTVAVGVAGSFAEGVVVTDPLPMGPGLDWSISPAYAGQGTCTVVGTAPAQQTLSCNLGDLGAAADQASSATVHVVSPTTALTTPDGPVTFPNTATASGDGVGPVTASAQVVVDPGPVVPAPNLTISKVPDGSVASGMVGFTVEVGNAGPATATDVTLNDPLPAAEGITWAVSPAYTGPGTCGVAGSAPQVLTCSFGDLPAGASRSVHVSSPSTVAAATTLVNVATASAANNPPVTAGAHISLIPETSVLGEQLDRGKVAADLLVLPAELPRTGLPAMALVVPALALIASGLAVTGVARRRRGAG